MVRAMSIEAGGITNAGVTTIKSSLRDGQVERVKKKVGKGKDKVVVGRIGQSNTGIGIGVLIIKVRIIMYVRRGTDYTGSTHWLTPSVRC